MSIAGTAVATGCGRIGFDAIGDSCGEVTPVYPAHAGWGQYVSRSELALDLDHQPDASCAGDEPGSPEACVHGGERRKLVIDALASCDGVTAKDELGVFSWRCVVEDGRAVVYTQGLRRGRGLAHLVTEAGWRTNRVEVSAGGVAVCRSSSTTWWDTPVTELPANQGTGAVELTSSDTVYMLASSRTTSGYVITADRVSVVILDGATLSYDPSAGPGCNDATAGTAAPNAHCVIAAGGVGQLWLEGQLAGTPSTNGLRGVLVRGTWFSRLHRLGVRTTYNDGIAISDGLSVQLTEIDQQASQTGRGISLERLMFSRLWRVRAAANAGYGISVFGVFNEFSRRTSAFNVLSELVVANNGGGGLSLSCGANHNVVSDVFVIGNDGLGVRSGCNLGTVLTHITVANSLGPGITIDQNYSQRLSQIVTAGNSGHGLELTSGSTRNVLAGVFATDNGGAGVSLDAIETRFERFLMVGNNAVGPCVVTGQGTPGLIDSTCTTTGADGSSEYGTQSSTAVLWTTGSAAAAFAGKVTTDDPVSPFDQAGLAPMVTDWWALATWHRAWGLDGGAFPEPGLRGKCTGNCRIWDWDVAAAGPLYARSGDGMTMESEFLPGAQCPAAVAGDVALEAGYRRELVLDGVGDDDGYCESGEACAPAERYLINATELLGDGVGDDDALCESGESCRYTPHLGATEVGDVTADTCVFENGTVAGVSIHGDR